MDLSKGQSFLIPLLLRLWKEDHSYLMSVCLCHSCLVHPVLCIFISSSGTLEFLSSTVHTALVGNREVRYANGETIKNLREEPALHPLKSVNIAWLSTQILPGLGKPRVLICSSCTLIHMAVSIRDPPGSL